MFFFFLFKSVGGNISVFIQRQISRMMHKQNKGSDFLPMQTLSIVLMSLIFHCELARINFCPSRRELEWGIGRIRGGLKNPPHPVRGAGGGGGGGRGGGF